MRKIIVLKSRDGTKNYLEQLKDKIYLLVSEFSTVRVSSDEQGYLFVDPSGGPFIARGAYLVEADAVVESIDHLDGKGFTITFK